MNLPPRLSPRTSRRPLLLGGALTVLLFVGTLVASLHLRSVEQRDLIEDFHATAHDRVRAIETHGLENAEHLQYVESLFLSSQVVERDEFRIFVSRLLRDHPEVLAVGWSPWVSASGVADVERRARADGLEGYEVRDLRADGSVKPRGTRPEYLPVLFEEAQNGGPGHLGIDLLSLSPLGDAVGRARGTKTPCATPPMALRGVPGHRVLWLLKPIRREGADLPILGVAWVILDTSSLAELAIRDFAPGGISFEGRDEATTAASPPDFSHGSRAAAPGEAPTAGGFVDVETFVLAGRRWTVRSRPALAWLDGRGGSAWWILLVSGLVLSLFLAISLVSAARRAGLVRRLVKERTAELTRLTEILEGTTDFVGITTFDGKAIYLNRSGRGMLGIPLDEDIRGLDIFRYHPERTNEIIRTQEFPGALREGTWTGEYSLLARDGREIPVSAVAIRHLDAEGKASCVSVIMRDITERKRIQEETIDDYNRRLEAALKDLHRAQDAIHLHERLGALGQMASGIAHDVNNALAPVVGYADLLLADPAALADREKAVARLSTIRTAAKDAAAVVGRLKEFYRRREETEPMSPVDLNRVIEETLRLTQPRWKDEALAAGVAIEVRVEAGDRTKIAGIESELREALTNLILNAVDAMPTGGTLRIGTGRREAKVVLSVSDTGVGMDEATRRRCLEPFFTTKGKAGTGMGLAMVYAIACRHEGAVEIDSAPGRGTTFRLMFPSLGTALLAAPSAAVRPVQARQLRVLVADDEPLIRELLKSYLQLDGHAVETAADGVQAIETFRAGSFDLVLTDSAMPGMRGEDFAREARRLRPDQRIALLTGFGDVMRAAEKRPEGIDVVLSKPISIEDLRAAVARLVPT